MSYVDDTKPSAGTYTNDTENVQRLQWQSAHRTWTNSHFTWASGGGATTTNDTEPSGSYVNDTKPS